MGSMSSLWLILTLAGAVLIVGVMAMFEKYGFERGVFVVIEGLLIACIFPSLILLTWGILRKLNTPKK